MIYQIDYLADLRHLTFVHLYSTFGRLPLLLADVASEIPGVEMVGLNRALWNVDRSGGELELKKWPRWKIKFSTKEDFLCEDDYWLFQYN
jgi:hypothetical protein